MNASGPSGPLVSFYEQLKIHTLVELSMANALQPMGLVCSSKANYAVQMINRG